MPPLEPERRIRRRDRESPVRTLPRSTSMEECESPARTLPRSISADDEYYAHQQELKALREEHAEQLHALRTERDVMKRELLQRIERLEHMIVTESLSRTPPNAQTSPGASEIDRRWVSNSPPDTPLPRPRLSSGSRFYKQVIVNAARREREGGMRRTVSDLSFRIGDLS